MFKKKQKKKTTIYNVAEFELCCANLQEMSGTACSDMWGLRSSSDLLSDRLSPCNLETTHNTQRYCTHWQSGYHHRSDLHFSATKPWRVFGKQTRDKGKTNRPLSVWSDKTKRKRLVSLCSPRLQDLGLYPGEKHKSFFWGGEFYPLIAWHHTGKNVNLNKFICINCNECRELS